MRYCLYIFSAAFMLSGCAKDTPPADFWGGVGFGYEANKADIHKGTQGTAASTAGFEKQLGGGFAIGGEVAGKRVSNR